MTKKAKKPEDLEKLKEKLFEQIKKAGLDKDYFFMSSFDRLEKQIQLAESYWTDLQETGVFILKTNSRGEAIELPSGEYLTCPNPSGDRYEKACRQIDSSLQAVFKMMTDARSAVQDDEL